MMLTLWCSNAQHLAKNRIFVAAAGEGHSTDSSVAYIVHWLLYLKPLDSLTTERNYRRYHWIDSTAPTRPESLNHQALWSGRSRWVEGWRVLNEGAKSLQVGRSENVLSLLLDYNLSSRSANQISQRFPRVHFCDPTRPPIKRRILIRPDPTNSWWRQMTFFWI